MRIHRGSGSGTFCIDLGAKSYSYDWRTAIIWLSLDHFLYMTFHLIPSFILRFLRRNFFKWFLSTYRYVYVRGFFLVSAFVFALGHKLTIAFKSIHFCCACTLYILHFTWKYTFLCVLEIAHFEELFRSDSFHGRDQQMLKLLWTLTCYGLWAEDLLSPALHRGQIPTVRQNEGTWINALSTGTLASTRWKSRAPAGNVLNQSKCGKLLVRQLIDFSIFLHENVCLRVFTRCLIYHIRGVLGYKCAGHHNLKMVKIGKIMSKQNIRRILFLHIKASETWSIKWVVKTAAPVKSQ